MVVDHREFTELLGQERVPIDFEGLNPPLRHFASHTPDCLRVLPPRPVIEQRNSGQRCPFPLACWEQGAKGGKLN